MELPEPWGILCRQRWSSLVDQLSTTQVKAWVAAFFVVLQTNKLSWVSQSDSGRLLDYCHFERRLDLSLFAAEEASLRAFNSTFLPSGFRV